MENSQNNKSIFEKIIDTGNALLDAQIVKAKTSIINANIEDEFLYSKAVVEDPSYSLHTQGFKDKPSRIQSGHLKQMSYQDTVIAGVIQTRQSQVSSHAQLVKSKQQKGFMIELKDEDAMLDKIKEELRKEEGDSELKEDSTKLSENVVKADDNLDETSMEGAESTSAEDGKSDDDSEKVDFELERKAKDILRKRFEKAKKNVEDYILNCGRLENRPFESKKWNFEAALRALTRDTLTYDLYAMEIVPNKIKQPHYWFPIDGSTIKQASPDLKKYKDMANNFSNIDILYPDRTEEAQQKQQVINLDETLLQKDAYRWVQVVKGKIERAYTEDELKVGIRNANTDIFNNGYGISELELLVGMVTGHLNAEYYNQAYFTQGFSAKGILHIKAAINKRKLETVRTQWQHMVKGARNSFQTPIFAGVEDVSWIPLTQNHQDIGFEGWMRYLTTMICSIYQIDPSEIGLHFKAEGSGGGFGSQENANAKMNQSKDKGLYPLLKHIETFLNDNIVKPFDSRFVIKFTGVDGQDAKQTLDRQKEEVKFKKTVNEIRTEDGLPPLPGMDDVILDPQYMAWYREYSQTAMKAKEKAQKDQLELMNNEPALPGETEPPPPDIYNSTPIDLENSVDEMTKSIKIEYYKLDK